jgi:hypothetical protein
MTTLAALVSRVMGDFFGANQNGPGNPLSNRNYVVDGNFDSWVSTSSAPGSGIVTNSAATMYYLNPSAGGTVVASQQNFPPGSPLIGMTSPAKYYLRHAQTVGSTTFNPVISHRIESAATLEGRSATFSCWLRAAAPLTITSIGYAQSFGTGGSPSTGASGSFTVAWNVTTSWQRFSVRLDISSIAGMVLGTNNNDSLNIQLLLPAATVFTLDTAQWQLEQTSARAPAAGIPTTFEYRGQQAEAARVQRYYQTFGQLFAAGYGIGGNSIYNHIALPVTMRAAPAATLTSLQNSNANTAISDSAGTNYFRVTANVTATGIGWSAVSAVLDARL